MGFKCRFTPAWHPLSDTGDQMKGHISSLLTHTIIRLQLAIMLHLMQIDGLLNQHMNRKRGSAAQTRSLHTQLTSHTLHKGLPDFPQDGEAEFGQMLGDVGIPRFCQQPAPTWHLLHDSDVMRGEICWKDSVAWVSSDRSTLHSCTKDRLKHNGER